MKDKLGRLMTILYAMYCDCAFKTFHEAVIEEVNNYIPLKRPKDSKQPNWIDMINNLPAKKTLINNIIKNKLKKKIRENKRHYCQKVLHKSQKNSSSFVQYEKKLSGNTPNENKKSIMETN